MPVCAAITTCFGRSGSYARCGPGCRSWFPRPIRVSPSAPRSIVVLAPISTSSSITKRPCCGKIRYAPVFAHPYAYPNPVEPKHRTRLHHHPVAQHRPRIDRHIRANPRTPPQPPHHRLSTSPWPNRRSHANRHAFWPTTADACTPALTSTASLRKPPRHHRKRIPRVRHPQHPRHPMRRHLLPTPIACSPGSPPPSTANAVLQRFAAVSCKHHRALASIPRYFETEVNLAHPAMRCAYSQRPLRRSRHQLLSVDLRHQ